MNVFFEEDGAFKVGTVLADNNTSLQVENPARQAHQGQGRPSAGPIRARPAFAVHGGCAEARCRRSIRPSCGSAAGESEFAFDQLGREYFGRQPTPCGTGRAAAAPARDAHAFLQEGQGPLQGRARRCPEGGAREHRAQEKAGGAAGTLLSNSCALRASRGIQACARELLYQPDKAPIEFKALEQAAAQAHMSHSRSCWKNAAPCLPAATIISAASCSDTFRAAPAFDPAAWSVVGARRSRLLGGRSVQHRRRDDNRDRRCVLGDETRATATGRWACTSPRRRWALTPDSPLDREAAKRLSTVYFPGDKITMLPEAVIDAVHAGRGPRLPGAVDVCRSHAGAGDRRQPQCSRTRAAIAANLRHDTLESAVQRRTDLAAGHSRIPDSQTS